MPNTAQHSKKEVRWGTPIDIIERARRVMGSIDLDPCSSNAFNEVVRADKIYSLDDRGEDGLKLPWTGNVFVNPPGGLVKEFWRKTLQEDRTCNSWPAVSWNQLIWIGFSLEQLAILANENWHPMDFSICILRKRLSFNRFDGYKGSPTHSNYIAGLKVDHTNFKREFRDLGRIYRPGS